MTLANGDATSGDPVATHSAGGKEHQVVMIANQDGHIWDSLSTYLYSSGMNVGAANKIHFEMFNAAGSGKIVKLRKLFVACNLAAITGVGHQFDLDSTTAVGTGGTTITGRSVDSTNAAIPAQVTARHAPTGGATKGFNWFPILVNPEETLPSSAIMPMINWLPEGPLLQDITLREGEGFRLIQITSNTAATWSVLAAVTIT